MSYQAFILSSNFKTQLIFPRQLEPLSLSWSCEGGPKSATLRAPDTNFTFEVWRELLGLPVEIFNQRGVPVWWGYINTIRQPLGQLEMICSLDGVANQVAVSYTSLEPSQTFGEIIQTPWASDPTSQKIYGTKQLILKRGMLTETAALQLRSLTLENSAFPQVEFKTRSSGSRLGACLQADSPAGLSSPTGGVYLDCLGWFSRLDWAVYQGSSGLIGNSVSQGGAQSLGSAAACTKIAQSFTPSVAMNITDVQIRVRTQGTPLDYLMIDLQTDKSGSPSGDVLGTIQILGSTLSSDGFPWVSGLFASPPSLDANIRYWLVAYRSGDVNSSNYYSAAMDETLAFTNGSFKVYNGTSWVARSTNADLLFKLSGVKETTRQMEDILKGVRAIFPSFVISVNSGISTPPYDRRPVTCKEALLSLIRIGTSGLKPICADVNRQRTLVVYERPDPGDPGFCLDENGVVTDPFGNAVQPDYPPVGQWLQIQHKGRIFVKEARLNLEDGVLLFD
ncbi:MAG: hypothetical protein WA110_08240 [Anaerolineaceae bacterium]